jgi:hypothetical protein
VKRSRSGWRSEEATTDADADADADANDFAIRKRETTRVE